MLPNSFQISDMLNIILKVRRVIPVQLRFLLKFYFSCFVSGSGIPIIKGEFFSDKMKNSAGKKTVCVCMCVVSTDSLLDKVFWFGW